MADFTLDLASIVPELTQDIEETIVRRFALGVMVRATKISPVNTGRFKNNWTVSLDNPVSITTTETSAASRGQEASGAVSRGRQVISGFSLLRNKSIHIQNNLPYSVPLETGSSSQAPDGVAGVALRSETTAFEQYGNS